MIFKNIFVPAYKSEEPDKRLASIAKLDPLNDKQKAILHELSFNDSNEKVTLAALNKLNDFVLWVKAAEHALSPVVKKHAQHMVYQLLEQDTVISSKDFELFAKECKNKVMLEHILFSSKRLNEYTDLSFLILQKLDNKQTQKRFFEQNANEQQQLAIISDTDDIKLLNRYQKTAKSQQVIELINEKLREFERKKEMPIKVTQQMTLINSRLLALKEASDYEYMQTQLLSLNEEFEQCKSSFHYLDDMTAATLVEKYLKLKSNLHQKLSSLEEAHNTQLALSKVTDDLSTIQERSREVQQQIDLLLEQSGEQFDAQVKILSNAVSSCKEDLGEISHDLLTAAHRSHIKTLDRQLQALADKLAQLPVIIAMSKQVADVTLALEKIAQGFSDDQADDAGQLSELEQQIQTQKDNFANITVNKNALLSESILAPYKKALAQVNKKRLKLKEGVQQQSKKIEGKLRVVNRLINDGKFTAAINTFHHASSLMKNIGTGASNKLIANFENTKLAVEKLQDWQAYIAQPRKPALLEETMQLANTPIDDHFERAENVKQLRQQWSSLGALHTEEDDGLNRSFDEAIEKAFAPCRVFFAELDKLRQANFAEAMQIIEEASKIDSETPTSELAPMIDKLKKRFQRVGDVDRNNARKIKRKFSQALKPLQLRISDMQNNNAAKKQALIEQATLLLSLEDAEDAAQQAKLLQKQWKDIGFAGKPQENQLWQAFREQNDTLFQRYHETLNSRQAEQSKALSDLDAQVSQLSQKVRSTISQAELAGINNEVELLAQSLENLDAQSAKKASKRILQLKESITQQNTSIEQNKQLNQLSALFDVLKAYTGTQLPDVPATLPSRYKAWLLQEFVPPNIISHLTRNELVQVASILFDNSDASTGFGDATSRKNLQMKLMANKLEGNETILPEAVLAAYVGAGPLTKDDLAGIDTVFAIFAKHV